MGRLVLPSDEDTVEERSASLKTRAEGIIAEL